MSAPGEMEVEEVRQPAATFAGTDPRLLRVLVGGPERNDRADQCWPTTGWDCAQRCHFAGPPQACRGDLEKVRRTRAGKTASLRGAGSRVRGAASKLAGLFQLGLPGEARGGNR